MVKNVVRAITLTSINSATLTGSYQAINIDGLPFPCFYLRINNSSNTGVTISYNGVTDNDYVLATDKLDLKMQQNAQPPAGVANWPKGTTVYVKGTAGVGIIYLSGYYQPQS